MIRAFICQRERTNGGPELRVQPAWHSGGQAWGGYGSALGVGVGGGGGG